MKTATLVKTHPDRSAKNNVAAQYGLAALYRLSEPATGYDGLRFSFVYVSTSTICGEPETYAFPAEESGNCLSWTELPASRKGDTTHAEVLAGMGYELEPERATVLASERQGGGT